MKTKTYIFAYGSNTNVDELCSGKYGLKRDDLSVIGAAILQDYEVQFSRYSAARAGGVLDIVKKEGSLVPGIVLGIDSPEVMEHFDRKEGAPDAYQRINCEPVLADGTKIKAITYEVVSKSGFVAPSSEYLRITCEGLSSFNLSTDHILLALDQGLKRSQKT
ncbi:MAG TPA: gamma-glutamylcyclotransferase [Oligoflexia bacterium]|nr:gamma-glutamylcyclotransferase [Oligoflexia bacterium]